MFFRVYMKNITYTISASRNILIKDALSHCCETFCHKKITNKFGSELDLDLMLSACLDDNDALWVFDEDELWQFNFLVGGCSFVVLLAPYKQIDDLFTEAQRVFNSLYKLERWKHVPFILHCRKDENIWNVCQRDIGNMKFLTIFSIFINKDTIYCCNQHVQLQDITILMFFPNGNNNNEYDELRLSLHIVEKSNVIDDVNSGCLSWKWISFNDKEDSVGFYLRTKESRSLISEESLEISSKEKDSGYLSHSNIGKIESNPSCEPQPTNLNGGSGESTVRSLTANCNTQSVIVLDDNDFTSCDSPSLSDRTGSLEHNVKLQNGGGILSGKQDDVTNGVAGNKRKLTKECIETCIEEILRQETQDITFKKLYKTLRKKCKTDIKQWKNFIKHNFHQQKKKRAAESLLVDSKCFKHCAKHSFLTKKDILTLKPGCWINDQIIDFYLQLVMALSETKSIYAFSSFFHTRLRTRGYSAVSRWTKKVDIFQKDLVVFPIHDKNHWSIAVASIPKKVITYYNPLQRMPNREFHNVLRDYFNQESVTKQYDNMKWKLKTCKDNPIQQNTDDCGIFVCLYAKCLAFDIPMNFTQSNIPLARRLLTKEICGEKLYLKIY